MHNLNEDPDTRVTATSADEAKIDAGTSESNTTETPTDTGVTENSPAEAATNISVAEATSVNSGGTYVVSSDKTLEVRILTIPGATYNTTVEYKTGDPGATTTIYQGTDPGTVQNTQTAMGDAAPRYSQAIVIDDAVLENHNCDANFDRANRAEDGGSYDALVEHESGDPISNESHGVDTPYDPSLDGEHYTDFLKNGGEQRSKKRLKPKDGRESDLLGANLNADAVDKNVRLVEARMRYEVESLKAQRRKNGYTFSQDVLQKDRTDRKLRKQINDRVHRQKRALKREQSDNLRYYTAAQDQYPGNPEKRKSGTATIEAIIGRLDYTLKERDRITDQLLGIYDLECPSVKMSKEAKVEDRAAKTAYKSQLKTAKRIAHMHIPEELRERIYSIMNERVRMRSTIEKNKYLVSRQRYTGVDKRDAKAQNRDMKRALRKMEDEMHVLMKKAEKHNRNHSANVRQAAWIVGTIVVVGAMVALYFVGKNLGWF